MARLTKDEKQKRKQYRKTCKQYKKELKDLVKHYGPWDNFLSWLFDIQVKHWIDYYSLGYNVWAMEVKDTPEFGQPDRPTRLEIAKELNRLYNEYDNFLSSDECNTIIKKYNSFKQAKAEVDAAYKAKKKAFFDYYMEYAQDMWD